MTFGVEVAGRERAVEITGGAGSYQATVDGRTWTVDAVRVGDTWSLLMQTAGAGQVSRSRQVTIAAAASGDLAVSVDGHPVPVRVGSSASLGRRRRDRAPADAPGGPQQVVAPMPGRIVKVLVSVGDTVAARQALVVVEAMKMENELRSPRAGTVAEVRVAEGAPVEAGAVLVVIA